MTDPTQNLSDYKWLCLSCLIFYGFKLLYTYNSFTLRYLPILLAVFSYKCHSYLLFNADQYKEYPDLPNHFIMSKDRLFRHIIQFSAMCLNQVYICVFLITEKRECIITGLTVQFCFLYETFFHPGIYFI
jgi:hypothetical protein